MALTQQSFMGALITDFNGSLGWGSTTSTLDIGLVEDPQHGFKFTPPVLGAPVRFSYQEWEFSGIYSRVHNTHSSAGRRYKVTLIDPRQILSGVQMILSMYTGGVFNVPNLYNVYGFLENTLGFGGSEINDAGIPWHLVRRAISKLVLQTPIKFRGFSYFLDLSRLPPVPDTYRIGSTNTDILNFIDEITTVGGADYFVELVGSVITVRTINRNFPVLTGSLTKFIQSQQSNIHTKDIGNEVQFHPTSKFVVGGSQEKIFYQQGIDVLNLKDEDGEPIVEKDVFDSTIWPFWGLNIDGSPILGVGTNETHRFVIDGTPLNYPGLGDWTGGYPTDINEMRAALSSQASWETFLLLNDVQKNWHEGKAERLNFGNTTVRKDTLELIDGLNPDDFKNVSPRNLMNYDVDPKSLNEEVEKYKQRVYDYIKAYASKFFGRQFMVKIPFVFAKVEPETNNIITSLQPSNSGFIADEDFPEALAKNLLPINSTIVLDQDEKVTCFVRFDGFQGTGNRLDLSQLPADSYTISGTSVFIKCELEPKVIFLDPQNAFSPRVVITLPGPVFDVNKTGQTGGALRALLASQAKKKKVASTDDEANRWADSILQRGGMDALYFGESAVPLMPHIAAIPLRSNVDNYGPWYNIGAQGGVTFEHNPSLVPWKFGGFDDMNAAGNALVEIASASRQVSEAGSIEVPGTPAIRMGRQLINNGPYVTNINVNIGTNGVTTNYRLETWKYDPGRLSRFHVERFQRITAVEKESRRLFRDLFRDIKPLKPSDVALRLEQQNKRSKTEKEKSSPFMFCSAFGKLGGIGGEAVIDVVAGNIHNFTNTVLNVVDSGEASWKTRFGGNIDNIFTPFHTDPGASGNAGKFVTPDDNATQTVTELNPYGSGTTLLAVCGNTRPDNLNNPPTDPNCVRGIGLRAPVILTGYGFATDGKPVPADPNNDSKFLPDYRKRPGMWKSGPLDARWNENRGVWEAAGGTNIVLARWHGAKMIFPGFTANSGFKDIQNNSDIGKVVDFFHYAAVASGEIISIIKNVNLLEGSGFNIPAAEHGLQRYGKVKDDIAPKPNTSIPFIVTLDDDETEVSVNVHVPINYPISGGTPVTVGYHRSSKVIAIGAPGGGSIDTGQWLITGAPAIILEATGVC